MSIRPEVRRWWRVIIYYYLLIYFCMWVNNKYDNYHFYYCATFTDWFSWLNIEGFRSSYLMVHNVTLNRNSNYFIMYFQEGLRQYFSPPAAHVSDIWERKKLLAAGACGAVGVVVGLFVVTRAWRCPAVMIQRLWAPTRPKGLCACAIPVAS